MMGRLCSFSHNKTKSLRMFPEKVNQSKKTLRKVKYTAIKKHYFKVWRLMFDVYLEYRSHVERGELLIKVSSALFSNQNCIRKVRVRYLACLVR